MAKKLIAIRASAETARQIDDLVQQLGDTKTGILTRAIDRLWLWVWLKGTDERCPWCGQKERE